MRIPLLAGFLILAGGLIVGVASLFFLLIVLNGYSERVAFRGLALFAAGSLSVIAVFTVSGVFLSRRLLGRPAKPFAAVAVPVGVFTALYLAISVVLFAAAVGIAEWSR
jgi:hypothetical protein